jgi:polyphenol oxidase
MPTMIDENPLAGWLAADGLPSGVRGGCATRAFAGVSVDAYARANYGLRSGDQPDAVQSNRQLLRRALDLTAEPLWLQQVHGVAVWVADAPLAAGASAPLADACVVRERGLAAVIQTADCLPILLAAAEGNEVAAIHAGWRGLAAGVIETTVAQMQAPAQHLHAWLGPAIGQAAFEVGPEVRAAFLQIDPGSEDCFRAGRDDRFHADLYQLARRRLRALGIEKVAGGGWCTVESDAQFHSFRRDGTASGRMASLIWRT